MPCIDADHSTLRESAIAAPMRADDDRFEPQSVPVGSRRRYLIKPPSICRARRPGSAKCRFNSSSDDAFLEIRPAVRRVEYFCERAFGVAQEVGERPVRTLLETFDHVRRDGVVGVRYLLVQVGDPCAAVVLSSVALTALQNATAIRRWAILRVCLPSAATITGSDTTLRRSGYERVRNSGFRDSGIQRLRIQ